jgi:hypothetical protein
MLLLCKEGLYSAALPRVALDLLPWFLLVLLRHMCLDHWPGPREAAVAEAAAEGSVAAEAINGCTAWSGQDHLVGGPECVGREEVEQCLELLALDVVEWLPQVCLWLWRAGSRQVWHSVQSSTCSAARYTKHVAIGAAWGDAAYLLGEP